MAYCKADNIGFYRDAVQRLWVSFMLLSRIRSHTIASQHLHLHCYLQASLKTLKLSDCSQCLDVDSPSGSTWRVTSLVFCNRNSGTGRGPPHTWAPLLQRASKNGRSWKGPPGIILVQPICGFVFNSGTCLHLSYCCFNCQTLQGPPGGSHSNFRTGFCSQAPLFHIYNMLTPRDNNQIQHL